ncbi:MAG: 4-(cytidine 5'-diphospho)-2-C-methyl-D-erythritol kinase [Parasporobacterium sp.]|nr:4-(cytidine 5'-diphospho)-2-C-methyl-D-erythritol kinase [Parasporobacterium sp.]
MDSISLRAMAKINLGLDVIRRREDGYHEVKMVMQTIRLYDRVMITRAKGEGIRLTSNYRYLPTDASNLAVRAARLLMDETEIESGLHIDLEKRIPVAAGMAGGSSDAAAVLVGVNRLLQMDLPMKKLSEIGGKIGADVPYCLVRGTALAEGIGEKLTKLPPVPECFVLVAKPAVNISTRFVYENLHAEEITDHPDIDGLVAAIKKGSFSDMLPCMGNVLERVSIPAYPVIGELKKQMEDCGAARSLMSGSGPTVFGLFDSVEACNAARDIIRDRGLAQVVYATVFYQPG